VKKQSKETLRAIFPPVVFKWMRWLAYKIDVVRLRGADGYADLALTNLVTTKTANFRSEIAHKKQIDINLTRFILPFAFMPKEETLNVLDFGGGGGIQYEVAKLSFPNQEFHWVIVENLNFVNSSNSQTSPELEYRSAISEAMMHYSHFDLVVASASLQYTEDPISYLQELCAIRAPYLYITRQILNNENEFVGFNQVTKLSDNGPGPNPPGFANKKTMYRLLAAPVKIFEETLEKNYSIVLRIKEEQNVHEFGEKPLSYFGYMCKLKA
jgi:putative methyltransferase (TIGR04325 family)